MYDANSSTNLPFSSTASARAAAVLALHDRCGVYTRPAIVAQILDAVGWCEEADLRQACLLEPASGDGEFVIEAARRLVISCSRQGAPLTVRTLKDRIRAFEIHKREAHHARRRVIDSLVAMGIRMRSAQACARAWIANRDFLLSELPVGRFTHAVGNPPYVRWSKVPAILKNSYERSLPREMVGGDLFLPFLDRALGALQAGGRCGFLCSDRWRYMAFAEAFRRKWLPLLTIRSNEGMQAIDAFKTDVDAYPSILIASRLSEKERTTPIAFRKGTLAEMGCVVRVGPALGHTPAFVLEPNERDVEPELLRPWLDGSEIEEGAISWKGRRIIAMYDTDGRLLNLKNWPRLKARLGKFRKHLKERSIVQSGAPWYRPIDKTAVQQWLRPKLLLPELAKIPRIAIDWTGAIPSHGVYAIFAPGDRVEDLYEKLRDGRLARALAAVAPKVKGGYIRCYKRFLEQIEIT